MLIIDAASVMSKWLGESEKNISKIFEEARHASQNGSPSIIFVDEIDSLATARSEEVGGEARARNQFLKEMDSIADKKKNLHVYLVGATNKPWSLDEPFIRRFQKRILIPLPDPEARIEMLKIYVKDLRIDPDVRLEDIAQRTEGYSGSDIRDILQSVQIKAVREFFESKNAEDMQAKPKSVTMSDFEEILQQRKTSVPPDMLRQYDRWFENFKAL